MPNDTRSRPGPKVRTLAQENRERTITALRIIYTTIVPRMRHDRFRAPNGMTSPSYNRGIIHDRELFRELAKELNIPMLELLRNVDHVDRTGRRIVREYMEDAAIEMVSFIDSLPQPIREVVELKSIGLSWKRVMEILKTRVYYSAMDDYEAGLRRIWAEREDLVRRVV